MHPDNSPKIRAREARKEAWQASEASEKGMARKETHNQGKKGKASKRTYRGTVGGEAAHKRINAKYYGIDRGKAKKAEQNKRVRAVRKAKAAVIKIYTDT